MKQSKLKFLISLVLVLCSLPSFSQTFKSKGITYRIISSKERTVSVIKGDYSYSGRVVIPSQVDYYGTTLTVKEIDEDAFKLNDRITSVVIPSTIEKSDYAFAGCTRLASVTLGNLKTIGECAFFYCRSLTSIVIPNSVIEIGEEAFRDCTGLTSINIGNSVTEIGYGAFMDCTGLTSIVIPNSVTSIGDEAFAGCTGLTSVTLGNSVTKIHTETFKFCRGLTSIVIPNSVTSIGDKAFFLCTGLTTVTIGRFVKIINNMAFNGCENLITIICEAGAPPSLNEINYPIFSDYLKPTLYVPWLSIGAYKKDPKWGQFAKIRAIE